MGGGDQEKLGQDVHLPPANGADVTDQIGFWHGDRGWNKIEGVLTSAEPCSFSVDVESCSKFSNRK